MRCADGTPLFPRGHIMANMKQKRQQAFASNKATLIDEMLAANIRDPKEQAMFLAQMAHESGGFESLREGNYRTAKNVLEKFKDRLNAQGITTESQVQSLINSGQEKVYEAIYGGEWGKKNLGNNKKGDGFRYRGRGFIQITGRSNYEAAGKALNLDLIANPELAENAAIAAKIATWFWQKKQPEIVKYARSGNVRAVTKLINGGSNGLSDRQKRYQRYLRESGLYRVSQAQPAEGVNSKGGISDSVGSAQLQLQSMKSYPAILDQRERFKGYQYGYGGNGKASAGGVRKIDCSNLVNQAIKGAGYEIPYENTSGLDKSKYYEEVDLKDVRPGDIALWRGKNNHTGLVEAFDAKTGNGKFFGSQSSTGPASAKFGPDSGYWEAPKKFLRPRAEYLNKAGAQKVGTQEQVQPTTTVKNKRPQAEQQTADTGGKRQAQPQETAKQKAQQAKAQEAAKQKAEQAKAQEAAKQKAEQAKAQEAAKQKAEQAKAQEAAKQKAEQAKAQEAAKQKAEQAKAQEAAKQKAEQAKAQEAAKQKAEQAKAQEAAKPKAAPVPAGGILLPGGGEVASANTGGADAAQLQAILSALQATLSQLSSMLSQPIQVTVDVQNGNIVAAVNAANSQQQRRS
ncbi:hypothetical protein DBB33_11355 [Chromobacterium haemolyticum]|nr:hypothetical protein DBB33_11355 [Chromobacterium haemolyticum]